MSTDHYFACTTCGTCIHVAQDGLSGFTFYSGEPGCMAELGRWLEKHSLSPCAIAWMSEHEVEDFEEVDWPAHNTGSVDPVTKP